MRLKRHFWRTQYFEDLLKRLETNSDVDPTEVELDKKRFTEMKNLESGKESLIKIEDLVNAIKEIL